MQCAPLQARLRLLNDWADVQRKLPEKAVESNAGGKTSHLLRPCPTPTAPDVWPVASSKAGGDFGGPGRREVRKGRGVRAGGGADVTCPSLFFVFQVGADRREILLCVSGGRRVNSVCVVACFCGRMMPALVLYILVWPPSMCLLPFGRDLVGRFLS